MGDLEFEALKVHFEELPQHFRTAPSTYTLVHAITPLEENKSFLEKVELGEKLCGIAEEESLVLEKSTKDEEFKTNWRNSPTWDFLASRSPRQRDQTETGSDSEETRQHSRDREAGGSSESDNDHISQEDRRRIMETERLLTETEGRAGTVRRQSRRRRRLPEIPKDKKPLEGVSASIFEELSAATPSWSGAKLPGDEKEEDTSPAWRSVDGLETHQVLPPSLILNLANLDPFDEQVGDPDSGMSTSHSPEGRQDQDTLSPLSPGLQSAASRLELLDPTHRGLHRFVPRHRDEILVDIGDPVYVQVEAEDGWCEGINLRTGEKGIFPVAHVVDVDYNDFDPAGEEEKKERYLLDYLGSVSCAQKGVEIIVQSVIKMSGKGNQKTPCILEIGDKGIKMVDKSKPGDSGGGVPSHEYFFSLKNVTFCGFHPKDHRYFGFITKHPAACVDKFACHVFVSESSTRCVAQAYGRAFRRFYQKFIETAFPTEDIYLE